MSYLCIAIGRKRATFVETLTTRDNKMVLADMVINRGLGEEATADSPFSMLTSYSKLKGLIGRKAEINLEYYDRSKIPKRVRLLRNAW